MGRRRRRNRHRQHHPHQPTGETNKRSNRHMPHSGPKKNLNVNRPAQAATPRGDGTPVRFTTPKPVIAGTQASLNGAVKRRADGNATSPALTQRRKRRRLLRRYRMSLLSSKDDKTAPTPQQRDINPRSVEQKASLHTGLSSSQAIICISSDDEEAGNAPETQAQTPDDIAHRTTRSRRHRGHEARPFDADGTTAHHELVFMGQACPRAALRRLEPGVWLNDQIVNMFVALICAAARVQNRCIFAFSTYMLPLIQRHSASYKSVRRALVKMQRKIREFQAAHSNAEPLLLFPLHLGSHWTLLAFDKSAKTILYYDSLGGLLPRSVKESILEALTLHGLVNIDQDWKLSQPWLGKRMQKNFDDCGVFVCLAAATLCGFSLGTSKAATARRLIKDYLEMAFDRVNDLSVRPTSRP